MTLVRGWCPTLDAPMRAADGWLVRVRPPAGRLHAAAARALADAAERWGSGRMELTSHANIQIRGVRDVPAFAAAMAVSGLPSPAGRVVVSPLAGDDPDCAPGTLDAAARVEARLARDGAPRPKWTAVVDGGGALGLAGIAADERVVLGPSGPPPVAAGPLPYRGGQAWGFGLPFGELEAPVLRALAALAEAHADGTLRLTPWRSVLLGRVAPGFAATPAGTVTDPADPVLRTSACIGNAGCAQGTVPARADARRLARPGLHVSGCAKGCAHPGPARLVLVGRDGRYDLVRDGTARDTPARRGLGIGR